MRLAKKALKISPDCADAYVLLAEEQSADAWEAREWYEKGVEAGERALGEELFTEEQGNFWAILETRPYMRALEGVASTSWAVGDYEKALAAYRRLLELNPNDNQGVRYVFVEALLTTGADDELEALFNQYPEEGAASWLYSRALWTFRKEGAGRAASDALRKAVEHNSYVPLYLLGRRSFLSEEVPMLIGFGDETEAVSYFAASVPQWLRTSGAVDWLRENIEERELDRIEHETTT